MFMRSDEIKLGPERAPHAPSLKSLGLTDEDIAKPFIGIANSYTSIVPGHVHLRANGRSPCERRHPWNQEEPRLNSTQ